MRKLHGLVWSEGMFLTPEHFQAQDRSVEDNLHFRFSASSFENWGLTEIKIDAPALLTGDFTLERCSGVMPDGIAFSMPDTDALPPSRAADKHVPGSTPTDVFLAIHERRTPEEDVLSVSPDPRQDQAIASRYIAQHRHRPPGDYRADDPNEALQFAKPNFCILFGSEKLDGFTCLRIAQLVRRAGGGFALNEECVAPCLDLRSSDYLMKLLKARMDNLDARSRSIDGRRVEGVGTLGFQSPADLWLLHTINTYLPGLKHIREVRQGHPERAYFFMGQLAGALCSLSKGADPTKLPEYVHKDLGACFTSLDDRIGQLLDVLSKLKCIEIPLTRQGAFWIGSLTEEHYFRNSHFFLAVRSALGVPDLITAAPQRIKISAKETIEVLYQNALPGVGLMHEVAPPVACPTRAGSQYFRLNQSGDLWDGIKQLGDIGIYVHPVIEQPELQLLIELG